MSKELARPLTEGRPSVARSRATILLVEDEEIVHRLMVQVLEMHQYRVLSAASGAEALLLSRGQRVDLLLADLELEEGMTGCRLARELRQAQPGLKVLYVSGYSLEQQSLPDGNIVEREIREWLSGYLEKPFSPSMLAQTVGRMLEDFPG